MADIFLSYSSKDKDRVTPLVKALQREGWSVWWDRRTPAGETFDLMIERELKGAKCVVVVWSLNSVTSDWVREEATFGKNRNALFPAKIDHVDIPLGFGLIQAVNLIGWIGDGDNAEYRHLAESISEKIGRKAAPSPKSAPQEKREPVQPLPTMNALPVNPVVVSLEGEVPAELSQPLSPSWPALSDATPTIEPQVGNSSRRNFLIGGVAASIFARSIISDNNGTQPSSGGQQSGRSSGKTNKVQFEMVHLPGGEFQMGSGNGASDEGPVHRVRIAPFSIGKYEVTQAQWKAVMGGNNPSYFKGDSLPVENVSWEYVKEFLKKLGNGYRLPTEAEWEYAARGGTSTKWSFGDDESRLGEYAWYFENAGISTHPVGQKKPNPFGLYDMHGNVWEWCEDVWHSNYEGAPGDGSAWLSGGDSRYRVLRGGSWLNYGDFCRSADRSINGPGLRDYNIGFRVVVGLRT